MVRRRLGAALAAVVLLLATVPIASAARATKADIAFTDVSCDFLQGPGGNLFFGVTALGDGTGDGYLDLWLGDPFATPPDLTRDFDSPVSASATSTSLTATIPLVDAAGNPAGTANLSADLEIADGPYSLESFRDGNRWIRMTGETVYYAVVGGSISIGSDSWALTNCFGSRTVGTLFATNPSSYVARFEEAGAACGVEGAAGTQGFLELFLVPGGGLLVFLGLDGIGFGSAEVALVDGAATFAMDVVDDAGQVVEQASFTVSLTRTDSFAFENDAYRFRTRVSGQVLDVEGRIDLGSGESFDLGACQGADATVKVIGTAPQGPRPGTKAPSNDLPTRASTLRLGTQASVNTRGATLAPEAISPCLGFDQARTVWYAVTGTGGPLTIDTTGSDFDTSIAVFTGPATAPVPLDDACNDDRPLDPVGFTWHAAVTWDTVAGMTYLVQVGGFPGVDAIGGMYGQLKVSLR